MTRRRSPAWVIAMAMLAGCGAGDEGDVATGQDAPAVSADGGIGLDVDSLARLGVLTAPLDAAEFDERVEGQGIVLEPQPIVQLLADRDAAEAAARQSRAASERAASLFGSDRAVSQEVLDSAERQAATDAAALGVARANAIAAYGAAAPWLDAQRQARIRSRLTDGTGVVVRASFPHGIPGIAAPDALGLRRVGEDVGGMRWQATDVWFGPADPAVPGATLLAYLDAATPLVPGLRIVASFSTGARSTGVVVPQSAIVFAGGGAWCYVGRDATSFVRRVVDLSHPVADGYFQASGYTAGESVVVAGAGLLLATELVGVEEAE
jgi:hypothetical protein